MAFCLSLEVLTSPRKVVMPALSTSTVIPVMPSASMFLRISSAIAVASMPLGVYLFQFEQANALVISSATAIDARIFFISTHLLSGRRRAIAEPGWGRNYGTLSDPG